MKVKKINKLLAFSLLFLLILNIVFGGLWFLCLFSLVVAGGVIIINHPEIGLHYFISALLQAVSVIRICLIISSLLILRFAAKKFG